MRRVQWLAVTVLVAMPCPVAPLVWEFIEVPLGALGPCEEVPPWPLAGHSGSGGRSQPHAHPHRYAVLLRLWSSPGASGGPGTGPVRVPSLRLANGRAP